MSFDIIMLPGPYLKIAHGTGVKVLKIKAIAVAFFIILVSAAVSPAAMAAQFISNGDFSAGLAGWTPTTTVNGVANATAASFDVTGSGVQTAARFNAGQLVFSFGGAAAGGGLLQSFASTGGLSSFSVAIAADRNAVTGGNSEGGIFSVLLNGVEKDSFQTGFIGNGQTIRSTLSFSDVLSVGTNTIELRVVRPFAPAVDDSLAQYFTNASLVEGAVPEPATWVMFVLGFGVTGWSMRRRTDASAIASVR
jgi:hypothetical protein